MSYDDGILLSRTLGTTFLWVQFEAKFMCIFIQENALENVVCEMAAILSRTQCVNSNADSIML